MAAISLENVNFAYNDSFRLEDIDLDIEAGALMGIIGPNGSGKSTLVKLMAGYLVPDSGRILLGGQPLARLKRKTVARKLAVVSQGIHTDFDFTVEEMVSLGRLPHLGRWQSEGPGDSEAIEWALGITHLTDFRQRAYNRLSGGEAQRVMVAQALAQQPEILLLDEPTTYMDMAYQQEMFTLMTRLNQEGITVVAVLHDVNMAALYCKELVAIRGGRIFAKGPAGAVITRENIKEIYGCTVEITWHPVASRPQITIMP
ncbi:MAG: ABC transporter ATP-binding protein [Eubacteriales bacterium]|nr:ABC transporter ATP-binding protein [Eubacteriales bacterium]